uniref:Uncharacterized protein n=1 Tax=Lotharella oceanica TaxID=641309 RepID=A0A7S2TN71_9EUKA
MDDAKRSMARKSNDDTTSNTPQTNVEDNQNRVQRGQNEHRLEDSTPPPPDGSLNGNDIGAVLDGDIGQNSMAVVQPLSVNESPMFESGTEGKRTAIPSTHPTENHPTQAPIPTQYPSPHPTCKPTHPTPKPTNHPTGPTKQPTNFPTQPTPHPTDFPTFQPTKEKSLTPTSSPVVAIRGAGGLAPLNPGSISPPEGSDSGDDQGQEKPALWRRWAWVCVPMIVIIVFGFAVFSSGWGQDTAMAWGAHGAAWGRPDTIRKMGGVYEKSALRDSKEPDYVTFAHETHSSRTQWRDMNYKRWNAEQTNSEGYGLADDGFYYRTDDYALSDPVEDKENRI